MMVVSEEGQLGVLDKETALAKAREAGLDLVLINPQADPPVAKIVSWSKFKYEQTKKRKSQKANKSEVKEMWFKPFIEDGDLQHKLEQIKEFLKKGNKVKVTVRAKGRSPRDKMQEVMNKVIEQLAEVGEPEGLNKFEGRNIATYIKPKH
ncbi:translation initiation factor IF-3 [Candidatus Dojkabacteria bacterium]|uniref:Translation initiation factor IF-3 n=1 Tax=Candidatus Dojkabacteria bacterium TaxID=2099670 RepID=A0A955I6Y6_9BACT|nr:translation initiation factor IF-3 [Candidatus Dojkabacteria bacterium]